MLVVLDLDMIVGRKWLSPGGGKQAPFCCLLKECVCVSIIAAGLHDEILTAVVLVKNGNVAS